MGQLGRVLWYRCSGYRRIAFSTTASSWGETSFRWLRSGFGSACRCAAMVAIQLSPSNGGRPVSTSYMSTPQA